MEKIKVDVGEMESIVNGEDSNYQVVEKTITGTWRHGNTVEAIVKRLSDGKFFNIHFRDSVSDEADFFAMNSDGEYSEVIPEQAMITIYVPAP